MEERKNKKEDIWGFRDLEILRFVGALNSDKSQNPAISKSEITAYCYGYNKYFFRICLYWDKPGSQESWIC